MKKRNAGSNPAVRAEVLELPQRIYREICHHAVADFPVEACGLLAGKGSRIERVFPMRNADASASHFFLDPEEQFAVVKNARESGLEIVAAYHSHPDGPCRPSAEDIRLALDPGLIHIILSLQGAEPSIGAFHIRGGRVRKVRMRIL